MTTEKPKAQHGGARAGAGRPTAPPVLLTFAWPPIDRHCPSDAELFEEAKQFLREMMRESSVDMRERLSCAVLLSRYARS